MSSLKEPGRVYHRRSKLGEWTQQQGKRKVKGQMSAGHWQGLHSISLWSRKSRHFPYSRVSRVQHSGRGWHPAARARACCETWTWHMTRVTRVWQFSHTQYMSLKVTYVLTCHPNTGTATPHRSGDKSVELNVEPPAAPELLKSSSSGLIPLMHANHVCSPPLDLCHWHFPSRCLVDRSSPQRHNLKLVFCQSFRRWKVEAIPSKLNRATVCCLHVGECISQILSVTNRWSILAGLATSRMWKWDHNEVTGMHCHF